MVLDSFGILFMQFFGVDNVLLTWERWGVFQYLLPFLLIFAVIYGILSYMKIFGGQRGVHLIIAIIIGILAIRLPFFTNFVAEVSPRLGVGVVIVLVLLILAGMFIPAGARGVMGWILVGVGAAIFIVIMAQLYGLFGFGQGGFFGGYGGDQIIPVVILVGLLIGLIVAVAVSGQKGSSVPEHLKHILKPLFGD